MTSQVADKIIIKGVSYYLFTNPLDEYWTKKNPKPEVRATTTSCWRGYIATWEISDGSLYLIDILFYTPHGDAGLDYLFPENTMRVKAIWFTGILRIPIGDCLRYVHGGYESVYDSDLFIKVKKGIVKSQKYKANY
jgi:hypothetical protein